jgi:predicted amidohydrolase YtcJ
MNKSLPALFAFGALLVSACGPDTTPDSAPDTVFVGSFVTLDAANAEVEAIAVSDGVITATGTAEEMKALAGQQTDLVEFGGVAVPGWIDGHVHISGLGEILSILNVQAMRKEEIVNAVADAIADAAPGDWIVGRGWDEGFFEQPEYPTAADLDAVSAENPVILNRIGGHSAWVNSRALEQAGIDRDTRDPQGGSIVRDTAGNATGMLLEQAEGIVRAVMPDTDTPERAEEYIRAALDQYRRWGLTGVHDAGTSLAEIRILKRLAEAGELPVRVYTMAHGTEAYDYYFEHGPETGLGDDHLTIRSFKIYVDGALGARGAEMSEPYTDAPDTSGLPQMSDEELDEFFTAARAAGMQVNGHVIGDLGVERLLDAIERNKVSAEERFRLEHASIISPANLPRFAELGAIAAMQPVFIGEYQRWGTDRVGAERAPWIMPIRDLIDSGARFAASTDYPASDSGDPRTTLNALVNRTGFDGKPAGGWYPEQSVDVATALRAMSAGNAYAAFQEDSLGALTPGRYADFTVLAADPRDVQPESLLAIGIIRVVVGGKTTWSTVPVGTP